MAVRKLYHLNGHPLMYFLRVASFLTVCTAFVFGLILLAWNSDTALSGKKNWIFNCYYNMRSLHIHTMTRSVGRGVCDHIHVHIHDVGVCVLPYVCGKRAFDPAAPPPRVDPHPPRERCVRPVGDSPRPGVGRRFRTLTSMHTLYTLRDSVTSFAVTRGCVFIQLTGGPVLSSKRAVR